VKNNVNKINLLRNEDFYIMGTKDNKIRFLVPTLRDYTEDNDLTIFFAARDLDWKTVKLNRTFNNYYELIIFFMAGDMYRDSIINTVLKFIPEARIGQDGIYIDKYKLNYEEFAFITDTWLVAMSAKKLDSLIEESTEPEELDPITKKMRESEEKIRRIKERNKKETDGNFSLDKLMIAVIKEFGLTMKEIWDCNLYTLLWYYEHALRYNNYRVNSIAFGNGLIKNHKYFID
jgi:hypothetical protein